MDHLTSTSRSAAIYIYIVTEYLRMHPFSTSSHFRLAQILKFQVELYLKNTLGVKWWCYGNSGLILRLVPIPLVFQVLANAPKILLYLST